MEKYTVKCNDCNFIGTEDDLLKTIEFKLNENSELEHLSMEDFSKEHKSLKNVFDYQIIDGCPNCLTDEYLMDAEGDCEDNENTEVFLEYKDVTIYYLYKDFETRDSVWDYHYTLDLSDTDGFDIRELSTYNEDLSIEENLKLAIDKNLL